MFHLLLNLFCSGQVNQKGKKSRKIGVTRINQWHPFFPPSLLLSSSWLCHLRFTHACSLLPLQSFPKSGPPALEVGETRWIKIHKKIPNRMENWREKRDLSLWRQFFHLFFACDNPNLFSLLLSFICLALFTSYSLCLSFSDSHDARLSVCLIVTASLTSLSSLITIPI